MLDQLLTHFQPYLSPELISAQTRANMDRLARHLPPLSGGGLEYHLGLPDKRTDFLLRATNSDLGRGVLAGEYKDWSLSETFTHKKPWPTINNFSKVWNNPNSMLFDAIENVWLEFDMLPAQQSVPDPCVFFDLDRHQKLKHKQKIDVLRKTLDAFNFANASCISSKISELLMVVPTDFKLYYIGLMLSRNTEALRACFSSNSITPILPYLKTINWKGSINGVCQIVNLLAKKSEKVILNLDVGEKLGEKMGLEIFMKNTNEWQDFFNRMVDFGLCSTPEVRALLKWPGYSPFPKSDFQKKLSASIGREITILIRRLNHVKLVCMPSGKILAKAYLYFAYY